MSKIVILDMRENNVIVRNFNHSVYEDAIDFLISQNLNPDDCHWMIVPHLRMDIK